MTPSLTLLALIVTNLLGCYLIIDSFLYYQRDSPGCQMSYSRPTFLPVPVPNSRLASKYSLYLFREGGIDTPNDLVGVPTLFIPGHAGSYKQARSIGAESAYYFQSLSQKNNRRALDVFTVDLNEEFSAFHGRLIQDQAEYLNDAIQQILSIYKQTVAHRHAPESVIIVGHSMGGIVARLMQHLPNYRPSSINTIFTMATPHNIYPVGLDVSLDKLYRTYLSQPLVENTALVSVAGGTLDHIINSDTAILPPTSLTVFATAIPGVWTGCDHMAVLWCNQLVKQVTAALVDIVDIQSPSQTLPLQQRMQIFRERLSPPYNVELSSDATLLSPASGIYMDHTTRQRIILTNDTRERQYFYSLKQSDRRFGVLAKMQRPQDLQIRLCRNSTASCVQVTSGFQWLPSSSEGKRQSYELDDGDSLTWLLVLEHDTWKDYDLLAVTYAPSRVAIDDILVEIGSYTDERIDSSLFDLAFGNGVLLKVNHRALASVYHFNAIQSPLLAYKLSMTRTPSAKTKDHQPLVQQHFYGELKYHILNNDTPSLLHFHRLHSLDSEVRDITGDSSDGLTLTIWPFSDSDLYLRLELDWYGSIGKCALRLGPALPMYLFVAALSYLTYQLSHHSSKEQQLSYDLAASLINWIADGKYSVTFLCVFVQTVSCLQQTWPSIFSHDWLLGSTFALPGFLWWLPAGLLLLSVGIICSVAVLLSVLIYSVQCMLPNRSASGSASLLSPTLWIVFVACLKWLPVSAVMMLVYARWLFLCAISYATASKDGDNSYLWGKYRFRFALTLVLTTLLSYDIPSNIVYIRDLMIDWKYEATVHSLVSDSTKIITLILLFFTEHNEWLLESSKNTQLISATSFVFVLYYTLFGIRFPFAIQHFVASIF